MVRTAVGTAANCLLYAPSINAFPCAAIIKLSRKHAVLTKVFPEVTAVRAAIAIKRTVWHLRCPFDISWLLTLPIAINTTGAGSISLWISAALPALVELHGLERFLNFHALRRACQVEVYACLTYRCLCSLEGDTRQIVIFFSSKEYSSRLLFSNSIYSTIIMNAAFRH